MPNLTPQDIESACLDGRFFRDEWKGPYGQCSSADLALIGENFGVFLRPSEVVSDYVPLRRELWGCDY